MPTPKPQFTNEHCPIHDLILHEHGWDGEEPEVFVSPQCLACIAENPRRPKVVRTKDTRRGFYTTPWTQWLVMRKVERDLGRRMIQYLVKEKGISRKVAERMSLQELSLAVVDQAVLTGWDGKDVWDGIAEKLRQFENDEAFRRGKRRGT